jgi:hypothetical protein
MKSNSLNKTILISIIVAVVVGAGAFFAGMKYQQSQRSSFARQFGGQAGTRVQGQSANRPVYGDIISSDDKSITVKMQDGSSKIVLITDQTSINEATQASKTDLKTGVKVSAFGTTNSDGSVTAQNIQLNPIQRGPIGGGTPR